MSIQLSSGRTKPREKQPILLSSKRDSPTPHKQPVTHQTPHTTPHHQTATTSSRSTPNAKFDGERITATAPTPLSVGQQSPQIDTPTRINTTSRPAIVLDARPSSMASRHSSTSTPGKRVISFEPKASTATHTPSVDSTAVKTLASSGPPSVSSVSVSSSLSNSQPAIELSRRDVSSSLRLDCNAPVNSSVGHDDVFSHCENNTSVESRHVIEEGLTVMAASCANFDKFDKDDDGASWSSRSSFSDEGMESNVRFDFNETDSEGIDAPESSVGEAVSTQRTPTRYKKSFLKSLTPKKKSKEGSEERLDCMTGIGLVFALGPHGMPIVRELKTGGPAALSGQIMVGDGLLKIDEHRVDTVSMDELPALVLGPTGSSVSLTLQRVVPETLVNCILTVKLTRQSLSFSPLKEGKIMVMKMTMDIRRRWKARHGVVVGRKFCLMCAKDHNRKKEVFDLAVCQFFDDEVVGTVAGKQGVFSIVDKEHDNTLYYFKAANTDELQSWLKVIMSVKYADAEQMQESLQLARQHAQQLSSQAKEAKGRKT